MTNQYTGFKVELTSSQLGKIVGIVSNVSENKISLINAVINNYPPTIPSFAVESRFIQNIRILSTASDDESSGSDTPVKGPNKSSNSSREQRREWLRNIPNACSVYVCPDSPPIIHRTPGAPGSGSNINDISNGFGPSNDLQLLDNALGKASIREPNDLSPARKYGVNNHRHSKRRSYSMSETAGATSDISGAESDSFHRYTNSGSRGQFNCGGSGIANRHAQNRGHPRDNNNNSHNHRSGGNTGLNGGGSSGQRNLADWDRICVEEFIDEDFDFEGNLALFNKSAFYEMVDSREGHSITNTSDVNNSSVSSLPHFIEGPDGVGIPLFTTPTQSSNLVTTMTASTRTTLTITSSGSHYEEKHKINNTQINTTSNNKFINHHNSTSSGVVTSSPAAAVTVHSKESNFNDNINNKQYYINSIKQRNNQYWYTCTGQRVPIFPLEQRQRLFNYLTTGLNLDIQISNKFQGITWGRFIESATRPLIDNIMIHLRQLNRTPQRIIHRPPARILIVSNGSNHLGAVLSLNVARYLSTLGACVLLVTSSMHCAKTTANNNNSVDSTTVAASEDVSDEYPTDNSIMSAIYRQELHLLMNLAPKPNQYGLDDLDDDEDDELDQYSDDGREINNENNHDDEYNNDKQIPGLHTVNSNDNGNHTNDDNSISIGPSSANVREHNDVDFDNMSCLNYSDISSIVDHSSVGRIWMSRMPGLKIIRRPSSVIKLPSSMRIDLAIIGHPDDSTTVNKDNSSSSSNTNLLFNWLRNHNSIGGIIHLTPSQSIVDSNILLRNAQHFVWVIELGLPILTPQCHSTSSSTTTSTVSIPLTETTLNSSSTPTNTTTSSPTHLLIDVGLGRNIVRKLTGDLNLLPPYGLFDLGSMIPLRSEQSNSVQQQISR
uniref:DFDF domain-containing protein n=1 Tax=Schistosoma mansoni TaxID=6183 RepID=A0A3Q0KN19_SCHMA